jgi:hypothetical protein
MGDSEVTLKLHATYIEEKRGARGYSAEVSICIEG